MGELEIVDTHIRSEGLRVGASATGRHNVNAIDRLLLVFPARFRVRTFILGTDDLDKWI